MDAFSALLRGFRQRRVRYVVIGVFGANYYARDSALLFQTEDRDLFLPPDPRNAWRTWEASAAAGFSLWIGDEPLDQPRDLALARQVVVRKALVRATHQSGLAVDLSLVMAGFDFEAVYARRRVYVVGETRVNVARLGDIVESKAAAGRPKDRLFLATHEEALRGMLTPSRAARRQRPIRRPPGR